MRQTRRPMAAGVDRQSLVWSFKVRKRSELPITETELRLIAAAANIGDKRTPKTGNSTPAAIGTPTAL